MDIELIIYGNWNFHDSNEERKAISKGRGFGVTDDFRPLATASGTAKIASNDLYFADAIRDVLKPPENKLKSLSVLTHSDGKSLWMAGELYAGPKFVPSEKLTPEKIEELGRRLASDLKGKILPRANVTLYACHAGYGGLLGSTLLKAFSQAFKVDCHGFKNALQLCVRINTDKKIKKKTIGERGWVRYGTKGVPPPCGDNGWYRDLRQLKPDAHEKFSG
jgi:hypothetical protein